MIDTTHMLLAASSPERNRQVFRALVIITTLVISSPAVMASGPQEFQLPAFEVTLNATDADGKFAVDRLPPVKMYVTPLFKYGETSFNLLWFSGLTEINPEEVTHVQLPRPGQTVRGHVSLPPETGLSLQDAELEVSVALRPPSISGFGTQVDQHYTAYSKFLQSDLGKSFFREGIPVESDGHFRIEGLPETDYVLRVTAYQKSAASDGKRGKVIASRSLRVHVPPKTDTTESVDTGDIPLQLSAARQ